MTHTWDGENSDDWREVWETRIIAYRHRDQGDHDTAADLLEQADHRRRVLLILDNRDNRLGIDMILFLFPQWAPTRTKEATPSNPHPLLPNLLEI